MPRVVRVTTAHLLTAAAFMDWQQVRLNGGPPCFHTETEGGYARFCGRAERWEGHLPKHIVGHKYVSLYDLLIQTGEAMKQR